MPDVLIDLATVERLSDAERVFQANVERVLAEDPTLRAFEPAAIGGWSALLAGLAMTGGALLDQPGAAGVQAILEIMHVVAEDLKRPSITPAEMRSDLTKLRTGIALLRQTGVDVSSQDFPSIVPSPSTVQQAQGQALANAVARLTVWEKAHHGRVHVPLTVAESQESAALHPFAQAAVDLGAATASGFKAVVGHLLPELRRQVVTLVRTEAQLRRLADTELRTDFRVRAQELAQRIGDVVRWLKTEALPDLAEQVKAERDARRDADHKLTVGLATTTNTVEGELTQLATQLAPLVAWAGGFGLHTTEKVKRNEEAVDRLGNMDWSQLLALTTYPGLVELTGKLLARLTPQVPAVIGGLEDAAFKALGAL